MPPAAAWISAAWISTVSPAARRPVRNAPSATGPLQRWFGSSQAVPAFME